MLTLVAFCPVGVSAQGDNKAQSEPQVSARAYVLFCADNGQILAGDNVHTKLGMASTTKVMTSLITLCEAAASDRKVKFTAAMTAEGSSMYLKVGDVVKLSDLAAGMMTVSGNDAANAAAVAIGGSLEGFAKLMNERAQQIGMKNTNFVTPSGLSHDDHYSTAYDMALLMTCAMENEDFADLTAKKNVVVDFVSPESQRVTYNNHNRLLSMYEYCIGGKTGYTKSTGRCLVTCAEKEGLRLVAVTLNDRNDWQDHIALYEYGFSNYCALSTLEDTQVYKVPVEGGEEDSVQAYIPLPQKVVLTKADAENIRKEVKLLPVAYAPVEKGDMLGKVVYLAGEKEVLSVPLVAKNNVEKKESFWLVRLFRSLFK